MPRHSLGNNKQYDDDDDNNNNNNALEYLYNPGRLNFKKNKKIIIIHVLVETDKDVDA